MRLDRTDRARLAVIAVGVALGIAGIEVIRSFVGNLLVPLISEFLGEGPFELRTFSIGGSEFQYGLFVVAALVAALTALIAFLVLSDVLPKMWKAWTLRRGNSEGNERA